MQAFWVAGRDRDREGERTSRETEREREREIYIYICGDPYIYIYIYLFIYLLIYLFIYLFIYYIYEAYIKHIWTLNPHKPLNVELRPQILLMRYL